MPKREIKVYSLTAHLIIEALEPVYTFKTGIWEPDAWEARAFERPVLSKE